MGIFNKKTEEKKAVKKPATKTTSTAKKSDSKKESMKDLYAGKEKEIKKSDKERVYNNAYRVLINPLITEKASIEGTLGKYTFEVSLDSNKVEVSKAIEEVYGIKPVSVNVVRMEGKKVRHGRSVGRRKDWKKAIVTLPKGKSINIYEGV